MPSLSINVMITIEYITAIAVFLLRLTGYLDSVTAATPAPKAMGPSVFLSKIEIYMGHMQ